MSQHNQYFELIFLQINSALKHRPRVLCILKLMHVLENYHEEILLGEPVFCEFCASIKNTLQKKSGSVDSQNLKKPFIRMPLIILSKNYIYLTIDPLFIICFFCFIFSLCSG